MAKLNQIVAVEKGIKNEVHQKITAAHQDLQKKEPLQGIARTYRPKDDDGEKLPGESKNVQISAKALLGDSSAEWSKFWDVSLTRDVANCAAIASVEVDGQIVVKDAPVSFLLFIEKQLLDVHTYLKKIPTLDPAERWTFDSAQNCYATAASETARTKKILRNHVKAEATKEHPAQVDVFAEDVTVGYWSTIKYSGAMPASDVAAMVDRVQKLQRAVKFARETANSIEALPKKCGEQIFGYLLGV